MPFHPPTGLRKAVLSGQPRIGVLCPTGSETTIELAAVTGYDWVLLDGEHGDGLDVGRTARLIRAADAFGIPVIVRVPKNDVSATQQVLDNGAVGICVPHIRTADEAARAVSYCKFPPDGERAIWPGRAAAYAAGPAWPDYWRQANDETMVIVLVEDKRAVENVEKIAAVPGVDVIWIGTGDLSQDMGCAGLPVPPELVAAVDRGRDAAHANKKAIFRSLPSNLEMDSDSRKENLKSYLDQGYSMFFVNEMAFIDSALRELRAAHLAAINESKQAPATS